MYQFRTGAAIPTVSDNDLRKVLILVPEKKVQEEISQKVERIYELRTKSIEMINELKETIDRVIPKSP